jgi:3D (Asp-Asp-Asp) domain-containing protein
MRRTALVVAATAVFAGAGCKARPEGPIVLAPVVVESPFRLAGAVVHGASLTWAVNRHVPVRYGDPVPVKVTWYCLRGTTRRGRYVRQGIVAADPRLFPLSRYIELYIGKEYLGRFLVDDTGLLIRGAIIDVWTANCRDAKVFGRRSGTAVLVGRPRPQIQLAGKPAESPKR